MRSCNLKRFHGLSGGIIRRDYEGGSAFLEKYWQLIIIVRCGTSKLQDPWNSSIKLKSLAILPRDKFLSVKAKSPILFFRRDGKSRRFFRRLRDFRLDFAWPPKWGRECGLSGFGDQLPSSASADHNQYDFGTELLIGIISPGFPRVKGLEWRIVMIYEGDGRGLWVSFSEFDPLSNWLPNRNDLDSSAVDAFIKGFQSKCAGSFDDQRNFPQFLIQNEFIRQFCNLERIFFWDFSIMII